MAAIGEAFVAGLLTLAKSIAFLVPWLVALVLVMLLLGLPRIRRMRWRRRLIRRLEEQRGSRVIAMIHRGSGPLTLLTGGGSIGLDEAESILKVIRETPPDKPIDLILHTPGGRVLMTAQIARALKNHPAPVRAIIPHWAMSGGTFLSLAADEIIMDRNAVLGPVDPQTVKVPDVVPMASIRRVIREKNPDRIEDSTWILADQAEKAIRQVEDHITWLLADRMGEEKAREVGRALTEGRWTHDFPLTCEALQGMGLKVTTDVPQEAYQLLDAFPAGARFRPVQWLPSRKKQKEKLEQ